jgi:hypothetical protein
VTKVQGVKQHSVAAMEEPRALKDVILFPGLSPPLLGRQPAADRSQIIASHNGSWS